MHAMSELPKILLSTDMLPGYGLDMIFELAKKAGFDGIDLAMRKSFDAWSPEYVAELVERHDLPVCVVQTSATVNNKELNEALDICEKASVATIAINSPQYVDLKTYNFIANNIAQYKKQNPQIKFSIINPPQATLFALPIPKYRFSNIVDIIKEYSCYLGLDIANVDEEALDTDFLKKLPKFVPYISVVYLADKIKSGDKHVMPGDGVLKLTHILKKFQESNFAAYMSLKFEIQKTDLSDTDKILMLLKRAIAFYRENYGEATA